MCAWWFHFISLPPLVNFRFSPEHKWKDPLLRKIFFFRTVPFSRKQKDGRGNYLLYGISSVSFQSFNWLWLICILDNSDLLETATHIICPKCHSPTNTNVEVKNTNKTHFLAFLMCLLGYNLHNYLRFMTIQFHGFFQIYLDAVFAHGSHTRWMVNSFNPFHHHWNLSKSREIFILDFRAVRHYCQKCNRYVGNFKGNYRFC